MGAYSKSSSTIFAQIVSAYFTHISVKYQWVFAFKMRKINKNNLHKSDEAIFAVCSRFSAQTWCQAPNSLKTAQHLLQAAHWNFMLN